MGTVILIRHARSVANADNVLAGQTPGVQLDQVGVEQSRALVDTLGEIPITKVFVSPLERCLQTISPWLVKYGHGVEVQSESRRIEPDYGLWSGRKLDELAREPLWQDVQNDPELVTFPKGERFIDVWNRVASFYQSLKEISSADTTFLIISHGDIIKFLLANVLKIEFKNFQSLVVEPGSISVAHLDSTSERLIQFNRSQESISSILKGRTAPTLGGENKVRT